LNALALNSSTRNELVLLDGALVNFFLTFQHEVFGHGARAREDGQSPQFRFAVPAPCNFLLDPRTRFGGFAELDRSGFVDRDVPMTFGGIESETFMTHLLAVRALSRDGVLHYSEQLSYLVGRLSYVTRLVDPAVFGARTDGSDPDSYALEVMNRFNQFGDASQRSVSDGLRRAWATQFLDPVFWLCAKQLFVDSLWRGDRWAGCRASRSRTWGCCPRCVSTSAPSAPSTWWASSSSTRASRSTCRRASRARGWRRAWGLARVSLAGNRCPGSSSARSVAEA